MKFTCEKSSLQEAINIVQKAVTGKSTMPILEGILIDAQNDELIFTGSDKDLSIQTKVKADIFQEGKIVVDSKLIGEIIRKLPNDIVEIDTIEENTIEIVCKKSKSNLVCMNADEYPEISEIEENESINIPEIVLKNMIKSTIFAVAQDETRPILTGILFETEDSNLNLVALDGYRLALKSVNTACENNISKVIPGKTLTEVSKILSDSDNEINLAFSDNHILFSIGNTKIVSILLAGEFIKYRSIIPDEYNLRVTVKRGELLESIERASLIAKDSNTNLIKLEINEENMVITSNSQLGKVREEINIILQGEPLQIAFNSKYLIDVLKNAETEEVVMEFSSSVSPCIIKNKDNDSSIYLVLPVRLLNNI